MKKYNKRYVYYKIFKAFIALVLLLAFFLVSSLSDEGKLEFSSKKIIITSIVYFTSFAITCIYCILYYNMTMYEIGDKELTLRKGVFFRKTTILSYDKIHAVDKKQGLIQKIFKLSSLSVDSGSTTNAHIAEIVIFENDYTIKELNTIIDNKRYNREDVISQVKDEQSIERIEEYKYNTKLKFLYALINSIFFLGIAVLYTIIASIVLAFIKDKSLILYTISLILLATFVFIYVVTLITSIFMYYDFNVYKNNKEIIIEHGLFTRVSNKLAYNRIHGVIVSQGLFQRIFGFASIRLAVVGYGVVASNNDGQTSLISSLIPFCRKKDVKKYIDMLLPEYSYTEKEIKSTNYRFHYLAECIITTIAYVLVLVLSLGVLSVNKDIFLGIFGFSSCFYVFVILITMGASFLQYKNSGMAIEDSKIVLYSGSLIYQTVILKNEHLIAIEKKDTYFRRKNHLTTYVVHYFANAINNSVVVPIIDDKYYSQLDSLIKK